jgi:hypothetical protein
MTAYTRLDGMQITKLIHFLGSYADHIKEKNMSKREVAVEATAVLGFPVGLSSVNTFAAQMGDDSPKFRGRAVGVVYSKGVRSLQCEVDALRSCLLDVHSILELHLSEEFPKLLIKIERSKFYEVPK